MDTNLLISVINKLTWITLNVHKFRFAERSYSLKSVLINKSVYLGRVLVSDGRTYRWANRGESVRKSTGQWRILGRWLAGCSTLVMEDRRAGKLGPLFEVARL